MKNAVIAATLLLFVSVSPSLADLIVAEDFLYAQPTKAFGPGGGFTRQDYGGGQNGIAGQWLAGWVSVGDGVITGDDITEGVFVPETDTFMGATQNGLSVNWLERNFQLNGLADGQTIFFGITMRSNNETALPNSSFLINDADGENQIGLGLFQGGFRAILGNEGGENPPGALPGPGLTDGLDPHRLIGKLEFNAAGDNERLTVWLDPTDIETAENSIELENDIVGGLGEFTGNLRLDHVASGGITLWDDLALGTTWEDVATVDVPRFTVQADLGSREVRFTNTTGETQELIFVQAESQAGFADRRWTSLASQGAEGWQENSPTVNRLTESNFTSSLTLADGESFDWGLIYGQDEMDIVAHVGTADGLLNLTNVIYGPIVDDLPGDANGDGAVDLQDFNILKANFGQSGGMGEGDFTGDGTIDLQDFNVLKANFGAMAGSAATVPEPGSLALACAGVLLLIGVRCYHRKSHGGFST